MLFCVTTSLLVVLFAVVVSSELVVISRHLRRDFLATHNFYRREVKAADMRRLIWDETLESIAIKRAKTCVKNSLRQHKYGENIFFSRHLGHIRGLTAIAIQTWANSGYNYTSTPYTVNSTSSSYTQLTWANTEKIGCAINRCKGIDSRTKTIKDFSLVVCIYDPKGNINYKYPYRVTGRKCSNCPPGTHCERGLCASGLMSDAPPQAFRRVRFQEKPSEIPQVFSGICKRNEKLVCECRTTAAELKSPSGALTETEKKLLLQTHNSYREEKTHPHVAWDYNLEVWAQYIIRCDPLYPGPRYCFTNFGKGTPGAPITNVVDDWVADKQAIKTFEPLCRTPSDTRVCNRNTNLMEKNIYAMACEAMACNDKRQLTCIYKERSNS